MMDKSSVCDIKSSLGLCGKVILLVFAITWYQVAAQKELAGFDKNTDHSFEETETLSDLSSLLQLKEKTRSLPAVPTTTPWNPAKTFPASSTPGYSTTTPEIQVYVMTVVPAIDVNTPSRAHEEDNKIDESDDIGPEVKVDRVKIRPGPVATASTASARMATDDNGDDGGVDDDDDGDDDNNTLKDLAGVQVTATSRDRDDDAVTAKLEVATGHRDLREETPPYITEPLSAQPFVVMSLARTFSILCQAEGHPRPSLRWFRDGRLIESSGSLIQAYPNGTLHFLKFSARENGYYQCTASNTYGTSVSVLKEIVYQVEPTIVPDSTSEELFTKSLGDAFSLACDNIPPTLPESIKKWYRHGNVQLVPGPRVGFDSEGTLHFAYLELSDSSEYQCALAPSDVTGTFIALYKKGRLQVEGSEKTKFPPQVRYASHDVKAVLYTKVTLDCFFSGNPVPKITWKNVSNHDVTASNPRYQITDFGRKLVINRLEQEDEGTFTCTANNGIGIQQAPLHVNVTSPPFRVKGEGLTKLTTPDQRDVIVSCKTGSTLGEDSGTPRWYRNGEVMNEVNLPDSSRYTFNSDRTLLTIRNLVKSKDTACYQCNVTNSEGSLFMDGYLRVIDSIDITKRPENSIEISTDSYIDITVLAKGDYCCKLDRQWYHNGTVLTLVDLQKPPFVSSPETGELYLNASSLPKDSLLTATGTYKCRVSDLYQSVEVEFVVTLAGDPKAATAGDDDGFKLWMLGIILGVLAIIVAIIVIIIVFKSNYPRDTYMLEKTELKHHLNPEADLLDQSFQEI